MHLATSFQVATNKSTDVTSDGFIITFTSVVAIGNGDVCLVLLSSLYAHFIYGHKWIELGIPLRSLLYLYLGIKGDIMLQLVLKQNKDLIQKESGELSITK